MSAFKGLFAGLIFIVLFSGCSTYNLNLNFEHVKGLKAGAAVIFELSVIGTVEKISYTNKGDFLVSVTIQDEFTSAITRHSEFYIAPSPLKESEKALIMALTAKGGDPLNSGTTIAGTSEPTACPDLGQYYDQMKSGYEKFLRDLHKIPESRQYKEFEKKLDELAEDMKKSGQAIQDDIKNNILPKLEKEIERLREKFEQYGKKPDVEDLENKLDNLREI